MLALDVARVEAGLLLIDVDFNGSKKALIPAQKYTPFEMGLGRLVQLDKAPFVGRRALVEEQRRGPKRMIVGLEVNWSDVESDLRPPGSGAGGAGGRVARRRARDARRQAGRPSHDHRVVADAEAADRAGHGRGAAFRRGHAPPDRNHG